MQRVRLEGHPWQPEDQPITNLHIFSQEEVLHNEHARGAFRLVATMLGLDLSLLLSDEQLIASEFVADDVLPAGIIPLELEDLAIRRGRLGGAGIALQQGALTNPNGADALVDFRRPWGSGDPAGGDIGACTLMVVT